MIISKLYTQNIVNEMKEIINQDLNFIDKNGIIIASTDHTRQGQYHEGAKISIENKKDIIVKDNNQYIGTKKGINMPVYFKNDIVGVIGITGEHEEVAKYGEIIRKMTEILIKEAYIKDLLARETGNDRALIEDILFSDKHLKNVGIINQVNLYKANVRGPKTVIISRELYDESLTYKVKEEIFKIYYDTIKSNPNNLIMQSRDFNIMIMQFKDKKDIENIINKISKTISKRYDVKSKFGVGIKVDDIGDLKSSYLKAKVALDAILEVETQKIIFYEDMDIELILNSIPKEMSKEFLGKIFSNLSKDEINQFEILFKSYEKNNGSITKIAEELFMHKNTIQYRLNMWFKKLGYDMRNFSDFTILKICITLKKIKNSLYTK